MNTFLELTDKRYNAQAFVAFSLAVDRMKMGKLNGGSQALVRLSLCLRGGDDELPTPFVRYLPSGVAGASYRVISLLPVR